VERSTRATTDADRGPDGFVFKTVSSQTRNFRCDHACGDGGVACVRTSAGRAASGSPRPERAAGCRAAGLYRSAAGARIQDWAGAALRPACPYLRGDGDITAVAVPGMIPARLAGSCPMLPERRWPRGAARSIGVQQGWLYGTCSFRLAFSAHVLTVACHASRRRRDLHPGRHGGFHRRHSSSRPSACWWSYPPCWGPFSISYGCDEDEARARA